MPVEKSLKKNDKKKIEDDIESQLLELISDVKTLDMSKIKSDRKKSIPSSLPKLTTTPTPIPTPAKTSTEETPTDLVEEKKTLVPDLKTDTQSFPQELDEMSDGCDNDDIEEILTKFKHDPMKEYNDVIFYHNVSQKCTEFIKNNSTAKFNEKQKKLMNLLVNKLYEKMIIYINHIELNNLNQIYSNSDEKIRILIQRIKTSVQRIIDSSYVLRKRLSYNKKEIIPLLNHSQLLFSSIVEIISRGIKESEQIIDP